MKTIAMLSQKGGTGKTTLTLHLAVAAHRAGKAVAVIDLDPQSSAAGWSDSRGEGSEPSVTSIQPGRLSKALQTAAAAGAQLVIIDTAPHSQDVAVSVAQSADLVLTPCRPGILDLRAIETTANIVKLTQKPGYVVLNHAPPRAPRLLDDAREALKGHGLPVAPVVVHQRSAMTHALTVGQTAQEYEPDGKAAEEVAALFKWVSKLIKL